MIPSLIPDALATLDLLQSPPRREQLINLVEAACTQDGNPQSLPVIAKAVDQVTGAHVSPPHHFAIPVLAVVPSSREEWLAMVVAPYARPATGQVLAAVLAGLDRLALADKKRYYRFATAGVATFILAASMLMGSIIFGGLPAVPAPLALGTGMASFLLMHLACFISRSVRKKTPFFTSNQYLESPSARYQKGEPNFMAFEGQSWGTYPDLAQWALDIKSSGVPLLAGDLYSLSVTAESRLHVQGPSWKEDTRSVWERLEDVAARQGAPT